MRKCFQFNIYVFFISYLIKQLANFVLKFFVRLIFCTLCKVFLWRIVFILKSFPLKYILELKFSVYRLTIIIFFKYWKMKFLGLIFFRKIYQILSKENYLLYRSKLKMNLTKTKSFNLKIVKIGKLTESLQKSHV